MNLESNCTNSNSSCDPTILSCQFLSSLAKSKAVKLEFFNSEEAMSTALGRAELRASVKVIQTCSLQRDSHLEIENFRLMR